MLVCLVYFSSGNLAWSSKILPVRALFLKLSLPPPLLCVSYEEEDTCVLPVVLLPVDAPLLHVCVCVVCVLCVCVVCVVCVMCVVCSV